MAIYCVGAVIRLIGCRKVKLRCDYMVVIVPLCEFECVSLTMKVTLST